VKKVLIPLALLLGLAGCSLPAGGGRPDVPAAAVSPVVASPSLSPAPSGGPVESADVVACRAARALDTAGATSVDYAELAAVVSRAQDADLAEAGRALARAAADGIGARSSFYAAYLDVMAQCLRFPEASPSRT
jgi:hypothetical protein